MNVSVPEKCSEALCVMSDYTFVQVINSGNGFFFS